MGAVGQEVEGWKIKKKALRVSANSVVIAGWTEECKGDKWS